MSQVSLTNQERLRALQAFGYTERESGFLCQAALHGGYFLRRQYAEFLGREDGGTVTQLVEKVLSKRHAQVFTYRPKTYLYHLDRRPFYEALGQPDNRNRRLRQPTTIKNKLMALDFVLAHPGHQYLATEQEKLDYFGRVLNVPTSALPVKLYGSVNGPRSTERYFVDKHPIFLSGASESRGTVSFAFVDEGAATAAAFETHLAHYGRLFAALGSFHLVYVAASRLPFAAAERVFNKCLLRSDHGRAANAPDSAVGELLAFFRARQQYEAREMGGFDRASLIRLRDDRLRFGGDENDGLYKRWKEDGDTVITARFALTQGSSQALQATFSTYLLDRDYGLFGNVTTR